MPNYCKRIRQYKLDGTYFDLKVTHKYREGYVYHDELMIYKKKCIMCGFTIWIKEWDIRMNQLDPF